MGHLPNSCDNMRYFVVLIASLFAIFSSMANAAGIGWTHPNGIGFRSGVYGIGLNANPFTGGYPHSHGLPHSHNLYKREAGPEPEPEPEPAVDNVLLAAH